MGTDLTLEDAYPVRPKFAWRHQYDETADEIVGQQTATDPELRLAELNASGIVDVKETEQHHRDNVDLNVMAERMGITDPNTLPVQVDPRAFGDVPEGLDLRYVLDESRRVQETFSQLPAEIKDRFANDPARLWKFLQDEKNDEEAVRIGLLKKPEPKKTPEPMLVKVVPDETPTT